jgi:hypothetical protein
MAAVFFLGYGSRSGSNQLGMFPSFYCSTLLKYFQVTSNLRIILFGLSARHSIWGPVVSNGQNVQEKI